MTTHQATPSMLPIQFEPTKLADVLTFESYAASLSSPIDSFLEDHILKSAFHRVIVNSQDVGHVAVHGDGLLTQFHLVGGARRLGSQVMAEVKQRLGVTEAFVPTCDEFFLSHAVEDYVKLEKQACFFVEADAAAPMPSINSEIRYRPAQQSDVEAIVTLSGDFLDKHAARIANNELHVGHLGNDTELVALGVIERSKLFPGQASIGMFTSEAHRNHGIGTSTIVHMRGVCRAEGLRPIAGCWYYNHASRKTLEAAGMTTPTRLLQFEFIDET